MKFDLNKFKELGLPRLGLAAPITLSLALISTFWAASKVNTAVMVVAQQKALGVGTKIVTLSNEPAEASLVLQSANRLAVLAPSVTITVNGSELTVSVKEGQLFTEWLNAVTAIQSTLPGYQWDAESICLAVCDDSSAAKAVLKPTRPRLNVQRDAP